jgi:hypothetical protein
MQFVSEESPLVFALGVDGVTLPPSRAREVKEQIGAEDVRLAQLKASQHT